MTIRPPKVALLGAVLCALAVQAAIPRTAFAQTRPAILEIDVENLVAYIDNIHFPTALRLGDITAVNGHAVKGTYAGVPFGLGLPPALRPGHSIADMAAVSFRQESFQILELDGTHVGTIMTVGPAGGPPPPGAPLAQENGDLAVVGGTGAFLGVRGEKGRGVSIAALRRAPSDEDPSKRRQIGGGHIREILYVIPMSQPEIVTTAGRPAVVHSNDTTPVSMSKPATAGEVLSLFATGLGPTRPSPDPGNPFPPSPKMPINSPLQVMVNGRTAEVISAIGSPGTVDRYQVNFRVPPGTEKGTATIQVTAAWIVSPPATFAVK
jgi:hypothetical protein